MKPRIPHGLCRVCCWCTIGVLALASATALLLGTAISVVWSNMDGNAELPADCIMVFGAAVHRGNMPGPGITRRVLAAVEIWEEGSAPQLYLSGGKGDQYKKSEAMVMQELAVQQGIPIDKITLEDQSKSTWQNLRNVRPLLDECESVVGVSDRYHLARIRYLAWLQDWETQLTTYPAAPSGSPLFELKAVIREAMGLLYYTLPLEKR